MSSFSSQIVVEGTMPLADATIRIYLWALLHNCYLQSQEFFLKTKYYYSISCSCKGGSNKKYKAQHLKIKIQSKS